MSSAFSLQHLRRSGSLSSLHTCSTASDGVSSDNLHSFKYAQKREASRASTGVSSDNLHAFRHAQKREASRASTGVSSENLHSFRHAQIREASRAGTKPKCATSQLDHVPQASPLGPILKHGEVVAFADRTAGRNGIFQAGDTGEASWQEDGSVHINWRNGSATKTAWPNRSWYRGQPRSTVHTSI